MNELLAAFLISWGVFGAMISNMLAGYGQFFIHSTGKNPFSRIYLAFFWGPITFIFAIFEEIYRLINR